MKALFSQRHSQSLKPMYKNKQFSFQAKLRTRLVKTLQTYNDESGYYSTIGEADEVLKKTLGVEAIYCRGEDGEERVVCDFWDFIKRGYPHDVLDAIEAFLEVLAQEAAVRCQLEINDAFAVFQQAWRVIDGRVFRIDSDYLAEEVVAQAAQLLSECRFTGPLAEFRRAREAYIDGNVSDTITNANKALESTIKAILGLKKGRPDELVRKVIDSGLVPSYWEGFLASFEGILQAVPVQRHQPGAAHGQGQAVVEFPNSLGELVLHLTGSLIVFLIKRHIELQAAEPNVEVSEDLENIDLGEDMPF